MTRKNKTIAITIILITIATLIWTRSDRASLQTTYEAWIDRLLGCTAFALRLWLVSGGSEDDSSGMLACMGDMQQQQQHLHAALWWHGPFFSSGGYASEAAAFMLALGRRPPQGLQLWISQHGDVFEQAVLEGMPPEDALLLLNMHRAAGRTKRGLSFIVCHSEPGAWARPKPLFRTSVCPPSAYTGRAYVIGRTMFETDRLSAEHVRRCNGMDEIWVPTEFHRGVFARSGVRPEKLVVVPEPVDVAFYDPAAAAAASVPPAELVFGGRQSGNKDTFVFLSVFKWERRNGWDVLLEAYLQAFQPGDNVALYLLTKPFHGSDEFATQMHEWASRTLGAAFDAARAPPVYVIGEHLFQADLRALYAAADAFVLPSRGEGWGRPHVEAMSMGLPVIATNWSGPTAFLDERVGYPLRIDGLEDITEPGAFQGHRWAAPSTGHLRQLMRHVLLRPYEGRRLGRAARQRMMERYSPDVVARDLFCHLANVRKRLGSEPGSDEL